jgi:GT2 family glycosyltransferase
LEVQLNEIAMHPGIAAVTSGVLIQYGDGAERVETGHSPETMTVEATLEGTPALIQTFLVRADVMRAIGGFDSRFRQFEDQECCVRLTAGGYTVRHIRKPLVKLYRGGADHLTNQWWPHTRGQLAVAQKHWALYNRVLGGREARRTVSRYVRRAGLRKGRILGRVVYAIGCVMGGDMRPALTLLTTGKMLDVPFDRARYC